MDTTRIIYSNSAGGVTILIPTGEIPIEQVVVKDVPAGSVYQFIDESQLPVDRTFRPAWVLNSAGLSFDLAKCKSIGHDIRRLKRQEEFAPLDDIIAKQIPGYDLAKVELDRQRIRDKYDLIQQQIDAATSAEDIFAVFA